MTFDVSPRIESFCVCLFCFLFWCKLMIVYNIFCFLYYYWCLQSSLLGASVLREEVVTVQSVFVHQVALLCGFVSSRMTVSHLYCKLAQLTLFSCSQATCPFYHAVKKTLCSKEDTDNTTKTQLFKIFIYSEGSHVILSWA